MVSKWELGKNFPKIDNIKEICIVLDISMIDLLCGKIIDNTNIDRFDINNAINMIINLSNAEIKSKIKKLIVVVLIIILLVTILATKITDLLV